MQDGIIVVRLRPNRALLLTWDGCVDVGWIYRRGMDLLTWLQVLLGSVLGGVFSDGHGHASTHLHTAHPQSVIGMGYGGCT